MNLTQLKCFWEIVNTGNFSDASENMYVSQSAVSKNIMALEKELELRLFERKGRKATLTPAGLKLATVFGEIINSYAAAERLISDIKAEREINTNKTIKLAGIPVIGNLGILSAINSFTRENPDIELTLNILDEDAIILSLQAGECDMAFCSSLKLNSGFYGIQKFSTQKFIIFVSSDNILADRGQVELKDLFGQKFIFPEPNSMLWEICVSACEAVGFTPHIIMVTNRPEVAVNYITNSDYIYMGIDLPGIERLSDSCRVLQIKDGPVLDFVFAWKRDKKQHTPTKALLNYLKVHFNI